MSKENKTVELNDEILGKVSGGLRIEPIDGIYHFRKYMEFSSREDTRIIAYYTVQEDKDATIEDTVSCYVHVMYDQDPIVAEIQNVSVSKLITCDIFSM